MREPCTASALWGRKSAALTLLTCLLCACDLPALPEQADMAPPAQDMSPDQSELGPPPAPICLPQSRVCQDNVVRVCSPDGLDFSLEICPSTSFCQAGQCLPLTNTCRDGEFFSLSGDLVLFDVQPDLKPSVGQLTLLNCGSESLLIQKATISSPILAKDQPVFSFETGSPQGLELPAGQPITMKLRFKPRQAQWPERGQLLLTLLANDELIQRHVELKTRTWCVGMTPLLDLGLIASEEAKQAHATVYNCGSMPITLSGVRLSSTKDSAPLSLLRSPLPQPRVLAPGASRDMEIAVVSERPGPINAQLQLEIPEQDAIYLGPQGSPTLALRGFAHDDGQACRADLQASAPLFEQPISDDLEDGLKLAPMSVHSFDILRDDASVSAFTELIATPREPHDAALIYNDRGGWFIPYRVGAYKLRTTLIDDQGVRSCQSAEVELDVRPTSPIYVELSWRAPDDPVPQDSGPGRGADLDLYARQLSLGERTGAWDDPLTGCFSTQPTAWTVPCLQSRGALFGANITGATPEGIALNTLPTGRLDLGVVLRNTAFFEPPLASLELYWFGQRDERLTQLVARALSGPTGFWLVGSLDLVAAQSVLLDLYLPSGFPE